MGAIAGIYSWDGRPVSEADLAAMTICCRPAGDDGGHTTHVQPGLAMQAHVLRFDRHSASERQPHCLADGSVLTWDGRLDNRDDLLLALHRDVPAEPSDVVLVAAAYNRWGLERTLLRLVGDWTFALWEASEQRIIIARDYMGVRPLYYRQTTESLAWSTSLAALTIDSPNCPPPDEAYIAGLLTTGLPPDLTPYKGVRILGPGHVLFASRSSALTVRRYWTYSPSRIRYRDAQAYTDHLRELLIEAVRVRLRTTQPTWAHLSGGWDSSTVVCLSHALIQCGLVAAKAVHPLSIVSSRSPESDESTYISAVERWCGLKSERYEFETYPTMEALIARRSPVRWVPFEVPVRSAGDRFILTGHLGDLVMGQGARQALVEPLHEGRPLETLRLCLTRARAMQRPIWLTLAQLARLMYAPRVLNRALQARENKRELARKPGQAVGAAAHGVTPALFSHAPDPGWNHPSAAAFPAVKRYMVMRLYRVADTLSGVEQPLDMWTWRTHPFSHRPLVEYMLATPSLAFWDPKGGPRLGMRRALTDILPPEILARTTKGRPEAVLTRAHRDWGGALADVDGLTSATVSTWEVVRRGYVDSKVLACEMTAWQNASPLPQVLNIAECIYVEAWLRSLSLQTGRSATRAPEATERVQGFLLPS
jgi:asparagine synthase (glutamine-hydrolysing)